MFVDEAEIYVKGGDGGAGCVSFRREKFIPRGGPDGGDGGDGGSVYLQASTDVDTLMDFAGHHHWRAENGRPGRGKNMTGRSGEDKIVRVPLGTLVYDKDTGLLLKDLTEDGQRVCVAAGGRGGRGNKHFASSTQQTPRYAEPGQPGQERTLKLELKLIADVGLVGLPNAGKSTLVARVSSARPKIADYPFTTLNPVLGIVELSRHRRFVIADLPGIIEGASKGAGLGDEFLKHIERTRVLLHLIDIMPMEGPEPAEAYEIIRNELTEYSDVLANKPEIIVANKMDLTGAEGRLEEFREKIGKQVHPISAVTGRGVAELMELAWQVVQESKQLVEDVEENSTENLTENLAEDISTGEN